MDLNLQNIYGRSHSQHCTFQKPEILGFFSIDAERKQNHDTTCLKYLRKDFNDITPQDLNIGYELYKNKEETTENTEKIDCIIGWLLKNHYLNKLTNDGIKTFISFRGILTALLTTAYEKEDWLICAMKVKNLIFLCGFHTERKMNEILNGKNNYNKMCEYWGRKFEQYMLTDNPNEKPNTSQPVNANEEFCTIFKSKLNGKYRLVYGAEMDGIECDSQVSEPITINLLNKINFVELKTSMVNRNHGNDFVFSRFKSMKWWAQSYLVGVDKIICGERDKSGILVNIQTFRTNELPKMSNNRWNFNTCLNTLDKILTFISSTLDSEPDYTMYQFQSHPEKLLVKAKKVTNSEQLRMYNFLPQEFRNECNYQFFS